MGYFNLERVTQGAELYQGIDIFKGKRGVRGI